MDSRPSPSSSVFSSVFGRRKSKVSRSKLPLSISLPPLDPPLDTPGLTHDTALTSDTALTNDTTPLDATLPDTTLDTDTDDTPPALHADADDTHTHAHTTALGIPPGSVAHRARHSIASSVGELGLQLRRSRSTSLRSASSGHKRHTSHASTASTMHSVSLSPDKVPPAAPLAASRPTLSISTFARTKAKSSDNVKPDAPSALHQLHYDKPPLSAQDKPKPPFAMAVPLPLRHAPQPKDPRDRQPSTAGLAPAAPIAALPSGANPNLVFQHIHELASKRISTLDYLRKAHEGRIYWFNTLLFSKPDLARLPSFTPRAQSRRATQYLLLGFSLPTILDLHATSPADYLRALNALLLEFEQYQNMHPTDGSQPSLSRARIPHMFKRANLGGKGRRSSSATGDFPLLTPQSSFGSDPASLAAMLEPNTADDLSPGESYLYLQTPSLPFDPDFFSTFATLCDVLIDCYSKMLAMLSTPESVALAGAGVPSTVGDLFSKADARVRKIILAGVVREFEDSCRHGVRTEMGGVGKVVLGGLM